MLRRYILPFVAGRATASHKDDSDLTALVGITGGCPMVAVQSRGTPLLLVRYLDRAPPFFFDKSASLHISTSKWGD